MAENTNIQLFEDKRIRTAWDADAQEWFFSVVDVVEVLTEQPTHLGARRYWSVLKTRMRKEGAESTTICSQLKMTAEDGKMRLTDVANTEQLLRIIQSIPSKKAEPFKLWLARVGRERIGEASGTHGIHVLQRPQRLRDSAFGRSVNSNKAESSLKWSESNVQDHFRPGGGGFD